MSRMSEMSQAMHDYCNENYGPEDIPPPEAAKEIERLRGCIAAIQKATVEGRVCDDVAWFDGITTLFDFCDMSLNPGDE